MSLAMESRNVGSVTVLRCSGRIVAGNEAASLEAEVRRYFAERTSVVLNLQDVNFVDSSGLGLLVRLTGVSRNDGLSMRLCSVTPAVQNILALTNLTGVLQVHQDEADAISRSKAVTSTVAAHPASTTRLLIVHGSLNLLASLRESLMHVGYQVHSTPNIPDAIVFLKTARPQLLIASPRVLPKLADRIRELKIPIIEIDDEFAQSNPAQAFSQLLERVRANLSPRPADSAASGQ